MLDTECCRDLQQFGIIALNCIDHDNLVKVIFAWCHSYCVTLNRDNQTKVNIPFPRVIVFEHSF